jgi:hypothetical protein
VTASPTRAPLAPEDRRHFRSMVQRLAAVLALEQQANGLYEAAVASAFTAEELGVRPQPA